jgi:hypothetical protein
MLSHLDGSFYLHILLANTLYLESLYQLPNSFTLTKCPPSHLLSLKRQPGKFRLEQQYLELRVYIKPFVGAKSYYSIGLRVASLILQLPPSFHKTSTTEWPTSDVLWRCRINPPQPRWANRIYDRNSIDLRFRGGLTVYEKPVSCCSSDHDLEGCIGKVVARHLGPSMMAFRDFLDMLQCIWKGKMLSYEIVFSNEGPICDFLI